MGLNINGWRRMKEYWRNKILLLATVLLPASVCHCNALPNPMPFEKDDTDPGAINRDAGLTLIDSGSRFDQFYNSPGDGAIIGLDDGAEYRGDGEVEGGADTSVEGGADTSVEGGADRGTDTLASDADLDQCCEDDNGLSDSTAR